MKVKLKKYPRYRHFYPIWLWNWLVDTQVKVELDYWDTFSLDQTLAHIIHPALIQIKEVKHGAPNVDNEDVPEYLHCPEGFDIYDTDKHYFDRWDYVLDEMIWAFKQIIEDDFITEDKDRDKQHGKRVDNGLRLFAKYYRCLWD